MALTPKKISDISKKAATATLQDLADKYVAGKMKIGEFSAYFLTELKHEYIRQFLYAYGDHKTMLKRDWGILGNALRKQYKYADNMLEELHKGNISSKELVRRVNLYMESVDSMFERALELRKEKDGYTLEKWIINPMAENCDDCLALARKGWMPIGSLPTPSDGSTQCMNNCKCHKAYRK